jgi:hypothetical protein
VRTGRVALIDASRMPAENPLYSDVANAGFKSAEKLLKKVDMVGLCKLNPVDPRLETARLQPLSLPLDPS